MAPSPAIELAVKDLGPELQPVLPALAIASRSLSRELATQAPSIDRLSAIGQ